MPVPTAAGPVAPRDELKLAPATAEPTAVPRLYADTDIATPSVGATPAKRTARDERTGLARSPKRRSSTTSTTVGTEWVASRQSASSTTVATAGTPIVLACGRLSPT